MRRPRSVKAQESRGRRGRRPQNTRPSRLEEPHSRLLTSGPTEAQARPGLADRLTVVLSSGPPQAPWEKL